SSSRWLVKARYQVDQRALPGSAGANQRDYLAFARDEIDVAQDGRVAIGEADVVETQLAIERGCVSRTAVALELGGRVENFEQPLCRCEGGLRGCPHLRELLQRLQQS